jgi:flagellin
MAFSIQTNVNSLIAQENLRVNSNFQSQTIQRLTSGYRINSSGDDAAGLAIANKFRSDTAELTQGVRNANDGVSQLQIMDGGMNNIGKMLDRLKTLATQSSSSTFTGDRGVLNKEYQTLVGEIDRQAQGIGLASGGHFAKSMGVYIGGGTTASGASDASNGTVTLDLANSVVDSKALGLRTSQFTGQSVAGTNLAVASNTSVAKIVSANSSTGTATATFQLSGPGFAATSISVDLTTSDTTKTVADKLNAAIQGAGNAGTPEAKLFRAANIQAGAVTDNSGNEQLIFTSSSAAFQVTSGTSTANALMGHFDSSSTNAATGASVGQSIETGTAVTATGAGPANTVKLTVLVNGKATSITQSLTASTSAANIEALFTTGGNYTTLFNAGVKVTDDGGKLKFTGTANQSIEVQVAGDTNNTLGLGSWSAQSNSVITSDTLNASGTLAVSTITVKIGSQTFNVTTTGALADASAIAGDLNNVANTATNGVQALNGAGVTITNSGNKLVFTSTGNQQIDVSSTDQVIAASLTSTNATSRSLQTAASPVPTTGTNTLGFSINGGQKILVSFAGVTGDNTTTANNLQAAIDANTELAAAGLRVDTTTLNITSGNQSVNFRVNIESQSGVLGFGATGVSSAAALTHTGTAAMTASSGASQTGLGTSNDVFSFAGLRNAGAAGNKAGASADQQVLSFSANDTDGTLHSTSVTLSASNAYDVNAAVTAINDALQKSGNPTLKSIVAVKETNAAGTAEGIRFISSANNFSVNVGMATNDTDNARVGMYDGTTGVAVTQGMTVNSSASGAIDITSSAGAKQAVTALGQAVKTLGSAQAAIGKGQNQLGYAINLANSQISNFSSAQAQIRDADVASEAANLSKAQVLQQASIAAMAQANSAPQAVLSLLKG